MGWISRTKEVGEVLNLLPDHFVTDACCSWTQLAFLTNNGDCLLWSNYTNATSKPVQVKSDGTKFKAVGCRESSCVLVAGDYLPLTYSSWLQPIKIDSLLCYVIK